RFFVVFVGASYVAWLLAFTIYRYAIQLELMASLLLVLAMRAALAGIPGRGALIATVGLVLVAVKVAPYWGRSRVHAGRYFDVTVPAIAADSLVLMMTGEPFGYIVPFIESGARVIA